MGPRSVIWSFPRSLRKVSTGFNPVNSHPASIQKVINEPRGRVHTDYILRAIQSVNEGVEDPSLRLAPPREDSANGDRGSGWY